MSFLSSDYTDLELRSIGKQMVEDGVIIPTDSIEEINESIEKYMTDKGYTEDALKRKPNSDDFDKIYSSFNEEGGETTSAGKTFGRLVLLTIFSVVAFVGYKDRKYIMPIMLVLMCSVLTLLNIINRSHGYFSLGPFVEWFVICVAISTMLSFVLRKADKRILRRGITKDHVYVSLAFLPYILLQLVYTWNISLPLAIYILFSLLIFFKKYIYAGCVLIIYKGYEIISFLPDWFRYMSGDPSINIITEIFDCACPILWSFVYITAGIYCIRKIGISTKTDKVLSFLADMSFAYICIYYAYSFMTNGYFSWWIVLSFFVQIFALYSVMAFMKRRSLK